MYQKAIDLDPTFAQAYAQLSRIHTGMYWTYYDRTPERLASSKEAADKALEFNPELPEAHLALGYYYYWGYLDFNLALEQFAIVQKSQPNNSEHLRSIGWVQRRQGKFEQSLANLKRAYELDPSRLPTSGGLSETRSCEYVRGESLCRSEYRCAG